MKIIIVQNEIEEAIRNYIGQTVRIPSGKKINLDITATRGSNGITCEITFGEDHPVEETVKPVEEKKEETPKKSMFGFAEAVSEVKKLDEEIASTEEAISEPPKKKSFFADMTV